MRIPHFHEPFVKYIQHGVTQMTQTLARIWIDYSQTLAQDPVAKVPGRPDGEIVAEFRIVETRPDGGFAEVMEKALDRADGHALPQIPEVDGCRHSPHTRYQRTVFHFKRHIAFFGFPDHIFKTTCLFTVLFVCRRSRGDVLVLRVGTGHVDVHRAQDYSIMIVETPGETSDYLSTTPGAGIESTVKKPDGRLDRLCGRVLTPTVPVDRFRRMDAGVPDTA